MLGAIASGISVASFAVQLTESVKKLKDFVSTIKNAPEDVKYTIYQLETLNALLNKMDKEIQPSPSMILENASLRECLALCQQGTNTLVSVATGLESNMKRRRRNRLPFCTVHLISSSEVDVCWDTNSSRPSFYAEGSCSQKRPHHPRSLSYAHIRLRRRPRICKRNKLACVLRMATGSNHRTARADVAPYSSRPAKERIRRALLPFRSMPDQDPRMFEARLGCKLTGSTALETAFENRNFLPVIMRAYGISACQ